MNKELPLRRSEHVQGNVLAGFNKPHMRFLLIALPPDAAAARAWLRELAPEVATTDQVFEHNLARKRGKHEPATWIGLALTRWGLEALGVRGVDRRLADHHAFLVGPAARAPDLGDVGDSAPGGWEFGASAEAIHAVVTVAADDPGDDLPALRLVKEIGERYGGRIRHELRGDKLGPEAGSHEHFGYRDGISQPRVQDFNEPGDEPLVAPGEFVLGERSEAGPAGDMPQWLRHGSFMVLRKLEQDVRAWRAARKAAGGDRWAAAMMGRYPDGTPTADARGPNDFTFAGDDDGARTPLNAHIRKVGPRDERFGSQRRRIMRRGIPYGPPYREDDPAERGMLFVAYVASIERQYEYVQRLWANRSDFPRLGAGRDPVIGRLDPGETRYRDPDAADEQPQLAAFVRTRGAVYAVALGRSALALLARG
jgi:Dyp-type peroxidase family